MSDHQNPNGSRTPSDTDDEVLLLASSMCGYVCAPITWVFVARGVRLLCQRIRRWTGVRRLERDFSRPAFTGIADKSTMKGTM